MDLFWLLSFAILLSCLNNPGLLVQANETNNSTNLANNTTSDGKGQPKRGTAEAIRADPENPKPYIEYNQYDMNMNSKTNKYIDHRLNNPAEWKDLDKIIEDIVNENNSTTSRP